MSERHKCPGTEPHVLIPRAVFFARAEWWLRLGTRWPGKGRIARINYCPWCGKRLREQEGQNDG